ncbi:MAG: hypothetical protein ACYCOU_03725 [Sulfobacillus sp.]
MKQTKKQSEQEQLISQLREWMPRGTTVYTILRSVSRSGMQRIISPIVFQNGEPIFPEYNIAKLLGWNLAKDQGIKVTGAGMDMGFHLVYTLSQVLYGEAYALKQRWL